MVLSFHRGSSVHQQLRQPVHLRRQVPRVPERHQTSRVQTESSGTVSNCCYRLNIICDAVIYCGALKYTAV